MRMVKVQFLTGYKSLLVIERIPFSPLHEIILSHYRKQKYRLYEELQKSPNASMSFSEGLTTKSLTFNTD